ncbi:Protein FAR-RED IMPAIRED RESPONSE 1, partial [Bienertia sinuspersici]
MRGIAPGRILTDQAATMQKFSQKLGKCKGQNEFKDELLNAMYDSLSLLEFESSRMAVINKHDLEDNMNETTQRVKSIHSFFDDYLYKHTTLAVFIEMYCLSMEKKAETKSRIMFLHCFQNVLNSDNVNEYTFEDRVWCHNKDTKEEFLTQYKRNYRVHFDIKSKLAECECSLFNHSGIMCRHMIKLYDILGEVVPDSYIMRRWRKDVSRKHTRVKVAYHDPSITEHVLAFEPICSKASVFEDINQLIVEFLELLDIRVDEKRVMIETEILNQTLSSVCLKHKQIGTPASPTAKRKADCGIPTPASDRSPSSVGNEGNLMDILRK